MSLRKKKICSKHGCYTAIPANERYCERHNKKYLENKLKYWNNKNKETDNKRENSNKRGYTYKWHKARIQYMLDNPLCVICKKQGVIKSAYCVDHIQPHRGNKELFWDKDNWQSLCQRCHSKKTLEEGRIND